jgi:hypothetical protein
MLQASGKRAVKGNQVFLYVLIRSVGATDDRQHHHATRHHRFQARPLNPLNPSLTWALPAANIKPWSPKVHQTHQTSSESEWQAPEHASPPRFITPDCQCHLGSREEGQVWLPKPVMDGAPFPSLCSTRWSLLTAMKTSRASTGYTSHEDTGRLSPQAQPKHANPAASPQAAMGEATPNPGSVSLFTLWASSCMA